MLHSLLLLLASSNHLINAEVEDEIPKCPTASLYKQLKILDNTPTALPKQRFSGALRKLVIQREMICPWEIQADFNADSKLDWIGFVYRDHQYQLIAYLSGPRRHNVHTLKTFKKFPNQAFLTKLSSKEAIQLSNNQSGNNRIKDSQSKFALVENQLKRHSRIYVWQNESLKVILEYVDNTEINVEQDSRLVDAPLPDEEERTRN